MIVLDIETSGTDFLKCGICQIGAIDLETLEEFFEEGRIDDEDEIVNIGKDKLACLEVLGKTEEELRDNTKQSQKELLSKFFKWIEKRSTNFFLCHNPVFDLAFLNNKASKYGIERTFHHRSFDLHTVAQMKFYELYHLFSIKDNEVKMGLKNILNFCGIEDNRKFHNSLEDAKITAECFSRLLEGKNIFPEYSKFEIPDYLKR
ncbi:MAG: exonuclease domain-containing protein [Nanoarchaeota archaeon]|nr:exonuclease domain-containing protein [Nanoarchaeota archaeon]